MRRLFLVLLLTGWVWAQGVPTDWPNPFEMQFDSITIDPPEPTRVELANGLAVYLFEDHSLPFVDGVIYLKAPTLYDPADKIGLAALTASLLREGGAGERSPAEVDEKLEFLAASVEASANDFYASLGFTSLSDNIDEVLDVWADVLLEPSFDSARLEIERQRSLEAILRENDNPVQIAVREFYYRVAEGHPSGNFATQETINAITRDDLISFYERFYQPSAAVIAITGDFATDAMVAKLNARLGQWQGKAVDYPDLPNFNPDPEPKIYYAPKEIAQSIILIGHPSVTTYSSEYNELAVANDILGAGGFSSRIFTEIRTKRGLAYSTGSFITESFAYPSNFVVYSISRGDATGEVLELLFSEIKRLQADGVTEEELERSRQTILNQSLFRFTSAAAVTARTARVQLLGLEPGYYERYLERVQTINKDEVQAAAQRELRPDEMIVLVVGDAAQFDRPLEDFGEVITIDLD